MRTRPVVCDDLQPCLSYPPVLRRVRVLFQQEMLDRGDRHVEIVDLHAVDDDGGVASSRHRGQKVTDEGHELHLVQRQGQVRHQVFVDIDRIGVLVGGGASVGSTEDPLDRHIFGHLDLHLQFER